MRNLKKHLTKSMKGQIVQQVLPIAIVPIVIIIMLIVFANFEATVDHSGISSAASTSINTTVTNSLSGFDLAAILPIVIAGVVILGILLGAFAFRGR